MRLNTGLALGCVLVALSTGACGGGDDSSAKPGSQPTTSASSSSSPAPTPTPTPSPTAETLVQICPEVEAALPSEPIPGRGAMNSFVGRLNQLQVAGDLEAQNALQLLLPASTELQQVIALSGTGSTLTNALSAWLDAISAFAKRCKAAGSSALQ